VFAISRDPVHQPNVSGGATLPQEQDNGSPAHLSADCWSVDNTFGQRNSVNRSFPMVNRELTAPASSSTLKGQKLFLFYCCSSNTLSSSTSLHTSLTLTLKYEEFEAEYNRWEFVVEKRRVHGTTIKFFPSADCSHQCSLSIGPFCRSLRPMFLILRFHCHGSLDGTRLMRCLGSTPHPCHLPT
jgi:hypothetical protein